MARLMSQIKGGYYAAAPEAVAAVLERLRPPERRRMLILDPCAGEGRALLQLAQGLQARPLRHRTVRRPCGPGAGIAARRPIAGPGRLPALCDQLPLVLVHLVQPALRLRHRRRRPGGKPSSSNGPPTCWPTTASWPWSARRRGRQLRDGRVLRGAFRTGFGDAVSRRKSASTARPSSWAASGSSRVQSVTRALPYDWLEQRMEDHFVYRLPAGVRPKVVPQDRSRPTRSWPGSLPRARCGSTSNVLPIGPIIAPARR